MAAVAGASAATPVARSDGDGILRFDLARQTTREINQYLHHELRALLAEGKRPRIEIENPQGRHNLAVGLDAPVDVEILGHGGYFIAGMNKQARVTVHGGVGWSVAENIMSGEVRVRGAASECAGASGHGGLVVIEGNASSRCAISLKGADVVVGGNVGHVSAFMAQAGRLVVLGDAGPALGDSLYEAVIYIRGKIHSLGADAREEPMADADRASLRDLLAKAGFAVDPGEFKRVASARTLYHWNSEAHQEY